MNENLAFRDHIFDISRKSVILALVIGIVSFGTFAYADIFIYEYPWIITEMRIGVIFCFACSLIIMLMFGESHRRIAVCSYAVALEVALIFGLALNFMGYSGSLGNTSRPVQVGMAIIMAIALFAGPIRRYVGKMIVASVALFLLVTAAANGQALSIVFEYYNLLLTSITASVFSYLVYRSNLEEFKSKVELKNKIGQLKIQIANKERLEEELHNMASYDSLTGFYNRGAGLKHFEELFDQALRNSTGLTICFVDLDDLKQVNDTYGHNMGDNYILDFVSSVKSCVRSSDVCVRLGGDEFLLVLPNISAVIMEEIWCSIVESMEALSKRDDRPYEVRASHGISELSVDNHLTCQALLDESDAAMYERKARRKLLRRNSVMEGF